MDLKQLKSKEAGKINLLQNSQSTCLPSFSIPSVPERKMGKMCINSIKRIRKKWPK